MARLKAINPELASGKTKELFTNIQGQLGDVPNMMRTMGNSPALLEGYLNFRQSLNNGELRPSTIELIAIYVGQLTACDYCLSAHTYMGKNKLEIDDKVLDDARRGKSDSPKTDAILKFVHALINQNGKITDTDFEKVKSNGISEAAIAEIIGIVGINIMTHYFNTAAQTEIDFPLLESADI